MKTYNLFYVVSQYDASGYNKIRITLEYRKNETLDELPQVINFYTPIDIKYQSNRDTPADWYGFDLEIHTSYLERWVESINLFKRIFKSGDMTNVKELTGFLTSNATRYIYDPRLSEYVLHPMAAEFEAWHDDHDSIGRKYGMTRVLALDESQAKDKINRSLIEYLNKRSYDTDLQSYYADWIAKDKPVLPSGPRPYLSGYEQLPDYRTMEQLISCEDRLAAVVHVPNYKPADTLA